MYIKYGVIGTFALMKTNDRIVAKSQIENEVRI